MLTGLPTIWASQKYSFLCSGKFPVMSRYRGCMTPDFRADVQKLCKVGRAGRQRLCISQGVLVCRCIRFALSGKGPQGCGFPLL